MVPYFVFFSFHYFASLPSTPTPSDIRVYVRASWRCAHLCWCTLVLVRVVHVCAGAGAAGRCSEVISCGPCMYMYPAYIHVTTTGSSIACTTTTYRVSGRDMARSYTTWCRLRGPCLPCYGPTTSSGYAPLTYYLWPYCQLCYLLA